jgi:hypothetical protein
MLPPNRPESVVRIDDSPAGATATQPTMGWSGTSNPFKRSVGFSRNATFFAASMVQRPGNSVAHFRLPSVPGSRAVRMIVLPLPAQLRLVRTFVNRTTSVSFGTTPST